MANTVSVLIIIFTILGGSFVLLYLLGRYLIEIVGIYLDKLIRKFDLINMTMTAVQYEVHLFNLLLQKYNEETNQKIQEADKEMKLTQRDYTNSLDTIIQIYQDQSAELEQLKTQVNNLLNK